MHTVAYEWRVSERVVLRPGDTFRARGGPFWRSGGQRVSLAAPGPFRFIEAHIHAGKSGRVSILAVDRDGHRCELRVSGTRWTRIDESVVPRLYTITGKKRDAKSRKTTGKGRRGAPRSLGTRDKSTRESQQHGVAASGGEEIHDGC